VSLIQNDFKDGGYYSTFSFHDITSGSNGIYTASVGWDPVTGMGSYAAYTPSWTTQPPDTSTLFIALLLSFSVFFVCIFTIFIILFKCCER